MISEKEKVLKKKIEILQKIDNCTDLFANSLSLHFNDEEINYINKLVNDGELVYSWDGDTPYSEDKKLVLTNLGKRIIFCANNANLIIEFCILLEENGYDNSFDLVMDFLATQNLEDNPLNILTIDNFKKFSIIYDRNISKSLYEDNDNKIVKILELSYKLRNNNKF